MTPEHVQFLCAIALARQYSSNGKPNGGMASVKVEYNPYQGAFEAEANWSDNTRIKSTAEGSPLLALLSLVEILTPEALQKQRKARQ